MEIARLATAIFVPWALGYFWLHAIEARLANHPGNELRRLGYGYFLGIAGLQGVVFAFNGLFGEINFWHIQTAMLVLSAPAVLLIRTKSFFKDAGLPARTSFAGTQKLFICILACWIVLHLIFNIVEILYRPIFPWDAWLNWMYRAKAWSFQQSLFGFSSPAQWLAEESGRAFNVAGHDYPSLVPVTAFWMATALGEWSETLVNVPVIFCGIAISLALYGQCRESGADLLLSICVVFFLLSMPLIGTHLSLGGKADIWMAGYTGLGFVAILRGITNADRFQLGLGLVLCAMAILVKQEGVIWLILSLPVVFISTHPKPAAYLVGLITVTGLAAWLSGQTSIFITGLGSVGLVENTLYLPFIGTFPLQQFSLWDDYLTNFFARDSWHILWFMTVLSLPLLWLSGDRRLRNTILCFYLVFVGSQLLIFGFTGQGRWAEDSTAINRLPIHFTPALLYCLAMPLVRLQQARPDSVAAKTGGRVLAFGSLTSLALTCGALVLFLAMSIPGSHDKSRIFKPQDMRAVVGRAQLDNDNGLITNYKGGIAIISSGKLHLKADELNALHITISGDSRKHAGFFWRTLGDKDNVTSLTLGKHGSQILDLSESPAWQGVISEIGLIFYEDGDRKISFNTLTLSSKNLTISLIDFWDDITSLDYWSQRSVNLTTVGANGNNVPLTLLIATWLIIALVIVKIFTRSKPVPAGTILLFATVAWMMLDTRWTVNRLQQVIRTESTYSSAESRLALDVGEDRRIQEFVQQAKKLLPQEQKRILITALNPDSRFQVLRAKYHLLPLPAYASGFEFSQEPHNRVDYIIIVHPSYLDPGKKRPTPQQAAARLRQKYSALPKTLLATDVAILYQLDWGQQYSSVEIK